MATWYEMMLKRRLQVWRCDKLLWPMSATALVLASSCEIIHAKPSFLLLEPKLHNLVKCYRLDIFEERLKITRRPRSSLSFMHAS